jgi:thioredoxin reductase (NADPH)
VNTKNLFNSNAQVFDAIIIGGGPAGISCALELTYCKINCLLVEKNRELGGQLLGIREVANFAAGYFKDGTVLARNMTRLAENMKLNLLLEHAVERIEISQGTKVILINGEKYLAKSIVIATGVRLKMLELPGLSLVADDVLYRDQSAPEQFSNMRVAIIGGGDNALDKALELAQTAGQVFLVNRSNRWRCRLDLLQAARQNARIEILENVAVESLSGVGRLRSACLIDKSTGRIRNLSVDKLFIKIGYAPNTEALRGQIALDSDGYIQANSFGETSVPGVFAAGDVVSGVVPRIATACGTGSTVASALQLHLGARQQSELRSIQHLNQDHVTAPA